MGLLVADDARVGRDRHLAIGERVQSVDGLVARLVVRHVDHDLHLVGRKVVDAFDLDLALFVGLDDRLLDRLRSGRVGNLGYREGAFVDLGDARAHLNHAAAQTVIVTARVHQSSRREIGQQHEILASQMGYAGVYQLVEVVGQDLRRQTHRDAVGSLRQQ